VQAVREKLYLALACANPLREVQDALLADCPPSERGREMNATFTPVTLTEATEMRDLYFVYSYEYIVLDEEELARAVNTVLAKRGNYFTGFDGVEMREAAK
jgi:hypothetical protein